MEYVRCAYCHERIGKQTDNTLQLGTCYFETTISYICKKCGMENTWISETEQLRLAALSAQLELERVKTELMIEKKRNIKDETKEITAIALTDSSLQASVPSTGEKVSKKV